MTRKGGTRGEGAAPGEEEGACELVMGVKLGLGVGSGINRRPGA